MNKEREPETVSALFSEHVYKWHTAHVVQRSQLGLIFRAIETSKLCKGQHNRDRMHLATCSLYTGR